MSKRTSDNSGILPHKRTCLDTSRRGPNEATQELNESDGFSCGQSYGVSNPDRDREANTGVPYNNACIEPPCQFCEPGCSACFRPCLYERMCCGDNKLISKASNNVITPFGLIQQTWSEAVPYSNMMLETSKECKSTCHFCKPNCSTCFQPCVDKCMNCSASEMGTTDPVVNPMPNASRPYTMSASEKACQHCELGCNICSKPCIHACNECSVSKGKCISTKDLYMKTVAEPAKKSHKKASQKRKFNPVCALCVPDCKNCEKVCEYSLRRCKLCKQPCMICKPDCMLCMKPCHRWGKKCQCKASCDFCIPECAECKMPCYDHCKKCNIPCKSCQAKFPGQQGQSSDCVRCGICTFKEKMEGRFSQWTSGNQQIDKIIQNSQLITGDCTIYLEWIDPERLAGITHIANGGFGSVYSATWLDYIYSYSKSGTRDRPNKVALKTLNVEDYKSGNVCNEIVNSLKISDDHTPAVYGISKLVQSNEYVIVMQYFERGNLHSELDNYTKQYALKSCLGCIHSIVKALAEVHKEGIIHCDLHSGNVLVDTQISAPRISDFGLSKALSDEAAARKGSYGIIPYMAPELFDGRPNSKATDIYALGMIMWEVTAQEPPFSDRKHGPQLMMEIHNGLRPPIVDGTPECWVRLIKRCWDADPTKRPTAEELKAEIRKLNRKNPGYLKKAEEYRKQNPVLPRKKIHPQAIYTSRFIPHLKTLSIDALNDDDWDSVLENMK